MVEFSVQKSPGDKIYYIDFKPRESRKKVIDYIPRAIKDSDIPVAVYKNFRQLNEDEVYSLAVNQHDRVDVRCVPAGFGGLAIGLSTGLTATTPLAAGVSGPLVVTTLVSPAILGSIVMMGISFGIGAIIRALQGSPKSPSQTEEQPSLSFTPQETTTLNGTPINMVYGKVKTGGHVLQVRTVVKEDGTGLDMNVVLGLGEGGDEGWQSIAGFTTDVNDVAPPSGNLMEVNATDASLFEGVTLSVRLGTKHQAVIPGFDTTISNASVLAIVVRQETPFQYTAVGPADRLEIKVAFPGGLFVAGDRGGMHSKKVDITFDFGTTSSYGRTKTVSVEGRQRTKKFVSVVLEFPAGAGIGRVPIYAQVTRVTADDAPEDVRTVSEFQVIEVTEILDEAFAYPGLALVGVKAIATEQLKGGTPKFGFVCEGTKTRVYTDPDTFTYEFTRLAAWNILDILTSSRRGLGGKVLDRSIIVQDWIDFAADNATLVADEQGNFIEKSYLDTVIGGQPDNGWEKVYNLCRMANATLIKVGGVFRPSLDSADDPVMMFTPGIMHSFTEGEVTGGVQPNFFLALMRQDEAIDYKENVASDLDRDVIVEGEEALKDEFVVEGVVRHAQALRLCTERVRTGKLVRKHASWVSSISALRCVPWDVVEVANEAVWWGLYSGRVVSATVNTIRVDKTVSLESGKAYSVRVWHPSSGVEPNFEAFGILSSDGDFTELILAASFQTIPTRDSLYTIGETALTHREMRIISMRRQPNNDMLIHALEYNSAIYSTAVQETPAVTVRPGFNSRAILSDVTDLKAVERLEEQHDGTLVHVIDVFYNPPASPSYQGTAIFFRVQGDATWQDGPQNVFGAHAQIRGNLFQDTTYEIVAAPQTVFGVRRHPDSLVPIVITLRGNTSRPADVVNFVVFRSGETLIFDWDRNTENDIDSYAIRQGPSWDGGFVVGSNIKTDRFSIRCPCPLATPVTLEFHIKAENTSGNLSFTAAGVALRTDPRINRNVVVTFDERSEDWPGDRGDFVVVSVGPNEVLELQDDTGLDATYSTAVKDLGDVFVSTTAVVTEVEQVDLTFTWANAAFAWNSAQAVSRHWSGPDGDINVTQTVEFRSSDTTFLAGDSTPAWQPYAVHLGEYSFRFIQFRIIITTVDPDFTGRLNEFIVTIDVPDVLDRGVGVRINGTTFMDFTRKFVSPNSIATEITVNAADTAARNIGRIEVSNVILVGGANGFGGFDVEVYDDAGLQFNIANHGVSRPYIDWIAKGF